MAKEAPTLTIGLDDSGGPTLRQIENDVTNCSWGTPRGVQDVTGVDSAAMERLLLLADFTATLNGVFNDAASTGIHTVGSDAGSTSVTRTLTLIMSGQTLSVETVLTDFQMNRAADGSLTVSLPLSLNSTTAPTWS